MPTIYHEQSEKIKSGQACGWRKSVKMKTFFCDFISSLSLSLSVYTNLLYEYFEWVFLCVYENPFFSSLDFNTRRPCKNPSHTNTTGPGQINNTTEIAEILVCNEVCKPSPAAWLCYRKTWQEKKETYIGQRQPESAMDRRKEKESDWERVSERERRRHTTDIVRKVMRASPGWYGMEIIY